VAAHASLVRLLVRLRAGQTESWRDEAAETIVEAMSAFEEAGDHAGLAKGWRLLAWSHGTACHFGLTAEAAECALDEARLAGDSRQETVAAMGYAAAAVFGPTPVAEAIERCENAVEQVSGDRASEAMLLALLASLLAMEGSFDRARELSGQGIAMLEELRLPARVARAAQEAWRVEMFAGDVDAAERQIRLGYDLLVELGEKYLRSTIGGLLGQTLYTLGRYDEAEQLARESQELATEDDVDTQALWRSLLSKLVARRGAFEEGEALVREALQILEPTDAILLQFGAYSDLAEVLHLAGRTDDSPSAIESALEMGELKQSSVMAAAAKEALAAATERSLVT
jgi:tetratricopeptide (TPR) repeat protein